MKVEDFVNDTEDLEHVVRVVELGSSSIDIMIVAYCEPVGFAEFNLIKENLIFNIMKIVKSTMDLSLLTLLSSIYVESMPN
jgi:MscS family membrane protein